MFFGPELVCIRMCCWYLLAQHLLVNLALFQPVNPVPQ